MDTKPCLLNRLGTLSAVLFLILFLLLPCLIIIGLSGYGNPIGSIRAGHAFSDYLDAGGIKRYHISYPRKNNIMEEYCSTVIDEGGSLICTLTYDPDTKNVERIAP